MPDAEVFRKSNMLERVSSELAVSREAAQAALEEANSAIQHQAECVDAMRAELLTHVGETLYISGDIVAVIYTELQQTSPEVNWYDTPLEQPAPFDGVAKIVTMRGEETEEIVIESGLMPRHQYVMDLRSISVRPVNTDAAQELQPAE